MWTAQLVSGCPEIHSFSVTGCLFSLLDVHGPSITSDTACSSGLVVLDQGSCSCFSNGEAVEGSSVYDSGQVSTVWRWRVSHCLRSER